MIMNESTVAFCIANGLRFTCEAVDGKPWFTVVNQSAVGRIDPRRISGSGASLDEAVKAYMTVALDERASTAEALKAYSVEPTADVAVLDAYTKDERVPLPVAEVIADVLPVEPIVEKKVL
jgi:hypothetical protein